MLKQSALLALLAGHTYAMGRENRVAKKHFHIGACDWSLGKGCDPAAFDLAKQIGLEGIMVDIGGEKQGLPLRGKDAQQAHIAASTRTGVKISSLAMGVLNNVPYKSAPETEQWVWDAVDVAKNLSVPVILLAFFSKNDLRNDEAGKKEVISRLKKVVPHAEKNGITLGIESYLNAKEHMEIIDAVGSKNIKVYYDFRNTADAGYDTVKEFKALDKNIICELHMKENGFLLGKGTLDWEAIGRAVYECGYWGDGWMQIEWALPEGLNLVEGYKQNLAFLQNIFSKSAS